MKRAASNGLQQAQDDFDLSFSGRSITMDEML